MKDSWCRYYLDIARVVAKKSKDPSTQVGCVLVSVHNQILATGYNGLPRQVKDDPYRYENRDTKLLMTVHAEANAVAAAARAGTPLYAHTAVVTFPPCPQCAALLIQSGISRLVCPHIDKENRWHAQQELAASMLMEARVRLHYYDNTL